MPCLFFFLHQQGLSRNACCILSIIITIINGRYFSQRDPRVCVCGVMCNQAEKVVFLLLLFLLYLTPLLLRVFFYFAVFDAPPPIFFF